MKSLGLYVHIPYCDAKCHYCDFYSVCNLKTAEEYTDAITDSLRLFGKKLCRPADTLYFGGGTPTLLGAERLDRIIMAAKKNFTLSDGAEITCETNPTSACDDLFTHLAASGVNRLSIGMQSADEKELRLLGRRHTPADVIACVQNARRAGIDNLSLDLMLGIPEQTAESLKKTLEFAVGLDVQHISAYILKIEPRTRFYRLQKAGELSLPSDDEVGDFYMMTAELLENCGYRQYEISNFAKDGFQSRQNLKYWHCEEYLGIGAAAHSFVEGQRFFYPNSLSDFMARGEPVSDRVGGDFTEYAMLRLRLTEGLREQDVLERFGFSIPAELRQKAKALERYGLTVQNDQSLALTRQGFLVSNEILSRLLL